MMTPHPASAPRADLVRPPPPSTGRSRRRAIPSPRPRTTSGASSSGRATATSGSPTSPTARGTRPSPRRPAASTRPASRSMARPSARPRRSRSPRRGDGDFVLLNGTRFMTTSGKPYVPFGHDFAWQNGADASYPKQLGDMRAAGLNWTRVWSDSWDGKNPYVPREATEKLPLGTNVRARARPLGHGGRRVREGRDQAPVRPLPPRPLQHHRRFELGDAPLEQGERRLPRRPHGLLRRSHREDADPRPGCATPSRAGATRPRSWRGSCSTRSSGSTPSSSIPIGSATWSPGTGRWAIISAPSTRTTTS